MKTPHSLTLYNKTVVSGAEVYTRHTIVGVMWEDRKAANVIASGLLEADKVAVYIPIVRALAMKAGDVLVKGIVTDVVGSSFTVTALKAKYPHVVIVRSVDTMDYGSPALQHVQVGAA